MAVLRCQPQAAKLLQKILSTHAWPVHVVQNPGYLLMPTSLGLMRRALQFALHVQVAVAPAIRPSGLYAIPNSAIRHDKTHPKALCTSKGSCLDSMW